MDKVVEGLLSTGPTPSSSINNGVCKTTLEEKWVQSNLLKTDNSCQRNIDLIKVSKIFCE